MLVEDFGVLYPTEDSSTLEYKLPDWFPVAGRAPEKGILLFDDRNQAGAELQKVLANICQSRTLHGAPMPDGWQVVSTGNRQADRAGAVRILSHLRNRETVLELDTHLDDWVSWAVNNGVAPEIVSFVQFRPDLLHKFDPSADQNPTPRSWAEGVSKVLGEVPEEAELECIQGAVGEGPAAEFLGFLRVYRGLPDLEGVLASPNTAMVPTDPAVLYAIATGLAYKTNTKNIDSFMAYIERLPPEFAVLAVSAAAKKCVEIQETKAFSGWLMKNTDILV
jgi:hypothetical protein